MNPIEELNRLIQEYIDIAMTMKQESLLMKMLTDKRQSDSDHPAHMQFYEAVGAWTKAFAAGSPSQEELVKALELLFFTAPAYKDKMPYWYLLAIQGHTLGLIPLLEDGNREQLRAAFEKQYPKSERLPIQKDIYRLLQKDTAPKKKGLFSFLK